MAGVGRSDKMFCMKVIEKEIEFYKEISGRLTTAFFISIGGTVATLKQSGWEMWSLLGAGTSAILFLALILTVRKWRNKIKELAEVENGRKTG